MKICPTCHKQFPDEARFCPKDGIPLAEISDPLLGRTLMGQFQIMELIGQGTMGKVYMARQISVDRKVAVKVLKKKLASDPQVVRRFHREAKAAARLSHPNIVTIHLVGELEEDHTPYMVMEYVEGASLEKICVTQGALPIPRVLTLSMQIASALAEAHRNGVLHRDLKPDNIAVYEQGTPRETAKVVDFGIAKILHSDEELSQLTKTGTIFGTPAYISPEQASGEHLDHRTDLYSLGVLMFRMATGHLPFENASGLEMLVRHIKEPPPRPRALNPAIPPELENIILRLLSKNREDRHPSADALLEDMGKLQAIFSGVFLAPPPPPPASATGGQVMNEPPAAPGFSSSKKGIFAVVAVVILIAAAVFLWKWVFADSDSGEMTAPSFSSDSALPMTPPQTPETSMNPAPEASMPADAPPPQTPPPPVQATPVVSCDFTFSSNATIRQVCAGRTVDMELACTDTGHCRLLLFIPGTQLISLKTSEKPRVMRRVPVQNAPDMLELQLAAPIRRNTRMQLSMENPPIQLNVLFAATFPEKTSAGSSPKPVSPASGMTVTTPEDTGFFQPHFIPMLPPDPMPESMESLPAMPAEPPPPAMGGVLPPDPE